MADPSALPKPSPLDAVKLFNEFQSQSRARGEATLKLVMGVSGGMLTLSVGAVLSATPAKISTDLLLSLQAGLGLLFFCLAASMLLMASIIVATFHMGVRWRKALQSGEVAFAFVATWNWLRIANALLAFLILCSFLGGIGLVARVAIGVVSSSAAGPTASVEVPPPVQPLKAAPSAPSSSQVRP